MKIFIIGSSLETARAMKEKELSDQIKVVKCVLDGLAGVKPWSDDSCVYQYRGREKWLRSHMGCLTSYLAFIQKGDKGLLDMARIYSNEAEESIPMFHNKAYFNHMKQYSLT